MAVGAFQSSGQPFQADAFDAHIGITVTNKDVGNNDTPGATQSTQSIAFKNNALYVLTTIVRGGTTPSTSAPSGGGLTWTQINGTSSGGPFMNQWWGFTTSGATTGPVTFTVNGAPTTLKWVVDEFQGVDTANPVPHTTAFASATNSNGAATLTVAFADPTNDVTYAVFGSIVTEAAPPSLESGWVRVAYDASITSGTQTIFTEYKVGQDLTAVANWNSTPVNNWSGDALEIRAAQLSVTSTLTQTADAVVSKTLTLTQTADVVIKQTFSLVQTADAVVQKTFSPTQSADAVVSKTLTKTQVADAVVSKTLTKIQSADAVISKTLTKTQTADVVVSKTITKTQIADADVSKTITKTQTADADVSKTLTKTQTADAIAVKTTTKTQSADAVVTIGMTVRDSGSITAAPWQTNSYAFENNKQYMVVVAGAGSGNDTTALSGGGITWTRVRDTNSLSESVTLYVGATASGASTGALTFTTTGTMNRLNWEVIEVGGADRGNNGQSAIVQSAVQPRTGATSSSVTLSAFADATKNAAFDWTYIHLSTETVAPEAGYVTVRANAGAGISTLSAYKIGEDTTVTSSWTNSGATMSIAAEIKFDPGFVTTQLSQTADAVVKKNLTVTQTADAVVKKTLSLTQTADVLVVKTTTKVQTADAVVKKNLTVAQTADADVRKTGITLTQVADVRVQTPGSGTTLNQTADAVIVMGATLLDHGNITASPWQTNSIAFANNKFYIVVTAGAGNTNDITGVSGGGITWTRTTDTNSTNESCSMFVGYTTSGATTGVLTFTFTGAALNRLVWNVIEIGGSDATQGGTNAIVQSAVQTRQTTATSSAVTLAAFGDSTRNMAFGWTYVHTSALTITPESGYTLIYNETGAGISALSQYKIGQDTSVTATWTNQFVTQSLAAEIKAKTPSVVTTTKSQTADVFATIRSTKVQTTDAVVKVSGITRVQTADAVVKKTLTVAQTADTEIGNTVTKAQAADAVVKVSGTTRSQTADAVRKATLTLVQTADVRIPNPVSTVTKTQTADAVVSIGFTLVDNGNVPSLFRTNSIAFQNNTLYLIVTAGAGTNNDVTAASGGGITWTRVRSVAQTNESVALFVGYVTNGATTGIVTFTSTGTLSRLVWNVIQVNGTAATQGGTDGIVQSASQPRTTPATSSSVTLAAFADAVKNATFGWTYVHASTITITPESGYNLIYNEAGAGISALSQSKIGEDTTVTSSWTNPNTTMSLAAEIKAFIPNLSVSKTQVADTRIVLRPSKVQTADAVVKVSGTSLAQSADAVVVLDFDWSDPGNGTTTGAGTVTKTQGTSAVVKKTLIVAQSADSFVRKTTNKTQTADVFIRKTVQLAQGTDVRVQLAGLTKSQTADVFIRITSELPQTADTSISKTGLTKVQSADSFIRKTTALAQGTTVIVFKAGISVSYTNDTFVKTKFFVSQTADAFIQTATTKSQTSDVDIRRTGITRTQTADAVVKKLGTTRTQTADAVVKVSGTTRTQTANAVVQKTFTRTQTADAVVKKTLTVSQSADAVVKKTLMVAQTADAVVKKTLTSAQTADALIQRTSNPAQTADVRIVALSATALSQSTDAVVSKTLTKTQTADVRIVIRTTKAQTADAVVKVSGTSLAQSSDTVVKKTLSLTQTADSFVRTGNSRTQSTDAVVRTSSSLLQVADAVVKKTLALSQTADVDIVIGTRGFRSQTADVRIVFPFPNWPGGDSPNWPSGGGSNWPQSSGGEWEE